MPREKQAQMRAYIAERIAREGAIRIGKAVGMLIAVR